MFPPMVILPFGALLYFRFVIIKIFNCQLPVIDPFGVAFQAEWRMCCTHLLGQERCPSMEMSSAATAFIHSTARS